MSKKKRTKKKAQKTYALGEKFPGIHFSKQEAKCMVHLLRGKSAKGIARALDLSPRTVEFYIGRMKKKFKCRTKFELIELILGTEFQNNIDEILMS